MAVEITSDQNHIHGILWCPFFLWSSQWIEDTSGTPYQQGDVIKMLEAENNKHYNQYLRTLQNDMNFQDFLTWLQKRLLCSFCSYHINGHNEQGKLKYYWSTLKVLYAILTQHNETWLNFHMLRFSHFCDSQNEPDKTDDWNDLWINLNI